MNEKQLHKGAATVFALHSKVPFLIATTDGHYWLPEAESLARDHARKKGLKVVKIQREDVLLQTREKTGSAPVTAPEEMTVAQVEAWAASQNEVPVLEAALEKVKTKGGKEAILSRIGQLQTP